MPTTGEPAPRPSRRLRRIPIALFALLAASAITAWNFSWWSPREYTLTSTIAPKGAPLTPAGHDARVTLLDDSAYILHIEPTPAATNRGALLFFGALHSKDPDHPQQAALQRAWTGFRPTVALVEGRMSFFVGTARQGITIFGEGATVYSLAERERIPLFTLEPPLEVEIAALDECGDRKQVALFRFLNGYMSAKRGGQVSNFKINRLLTKRVAPLTDTLPDIPALDTYFAAQFPQLKGWRDLPEQALWPGRTDTWLNQMATRSNQARDAHFTRTILDLVAKGDRVLAIAGRSHTINLEPVLWASIQPATHGQLSSPRPWEKHTD